MAYDSTTVPVSRSQEQIRDVLRKRGAARINFGEQFADDGGGTVGVEFIYLDTLIRMLATLKVPERAVVMEKERRSRTKTATDIRAELLEQEARRVWRVLHWAVKIRMESVEEGLETFEQAFLPHIVDPASNRTLWDVMRPSVEDGALRLNGSGLRALTAGAA